jgi:uncharacterized protein YggE
MRILLVSAIVALSAPARAQTPTAPTGPGVISVTGDATITAKPDQAQIDVGVVSQAANAGAAAAENARKMDKIVTALKKEVGAGGEVKTASYSVSPRYGQPKPGQDYAPVVGYTVSNVVRARVNDINAVGRLVDLALKLGANDVQRVTFSLRDPEPPHAEALRAAAIKARARASALAGALGLKLGPLVSLTEATAYQGPMEVADSFKVRTMAARDVATPVEAGTLDIRADVTAVFSVAR